jgi:hypothetical protein
MVPEETEHFGLVVQAAAVGDAVLPTDVIQQPEPGRAARGGAADGGGTMDFWRGTGPR